MGLKSILGKPYAKLVAKSNKNGLRGLLIHKIVFFGL